MTTSPPHLPTAAPLLAALEQLGPSPALTWYAREGRTELSGAVLANWLIKSIEHLDGEIALAPGASAIIDMPVHWKSAVLRLALLSLGAHVGAPGNEDTPSGAGMIDVLVTDTPGSSLADGADQVLAVEPVSLAMRFGGDLPALAHDWVQEVRGHPDQLQVALPRWSGPQPREVDPSSAIVVDGDGGRAGELALMLGAWLHGGRVLAPAAAITAEQYAAEGIARPRR